MGELAQGFEKTEVVCGINLFPMEMVKKQKKAKLFLCTTRGCYLTGQFLTPLIKEKNQLNSLWEKVM